MIDKLLKLMAALILTLTFSGCEKPGYPAETNRILVLMSDFGLSERFVASMKGVALTVDPRLQVHDLTHQVEPFNIAEAAQTLAGTINYWPRGTVFVVVVDPGVGTARKSVVLKTKTGQFVVAPDNGVLSSVAEQFGIAELREIDETKNRLPGSEAAHTFHGRDVYSYTGARLAGGVISFSQTGPSLHPQVVQLPQKNARLLDASTITGTVTRIEKPYGNIVTNIPRALFDAFKLDPDNLPVLKVELSNKGKRVLNQRLPYVKSFGHVPMGKPLLYVDSVQQMGLAVNGGSFAEIFQISAGTDWEIKLGKIQSD